MLSNSKQEKNLWMLRTKKKLSQAGVFFEKMEQKWSKKNGPD
jgi:hypothetical protein